MTRAFEPRGAWTALVTPFTPGGDLDAGAYARLVEFQLAAGIDGLVPCGTTGESPTLSWEEQGAMVGTCVRLSKGRAGVLAGAGSNCTEEAINGVRDVWSRGASAALLVDCYYNGPSSLELRREYYERVLAAVPEIPIVPYIIPGRTGCSLQPQDLALLHLSHPERVQAVKSATGDLDRMRIERSVAGPRLSILSGDDELTLTMMSDEAIRASGAISVMSNIAPAAVKELTVSAAAGNVVRAGELNRALSPLFESMTIVVENERTLPDGRVVSVTDRFRNPVAVKTMMAGLGMIGRTLRPPLGQMTPNALAKCRSAVRAVFERNPEILTPIEEVFGVQLVQRLEDAALWGL